MLPGAGLRAQAARRRPGSWSSFWAAPVVLRARASTAVIRRLDGV